MLKWDIATLTISHFLLEQLGLNKRDQCQN